ncbi:MAG TPA: amidohydrolase family protein [Micromonosporaceae bacterium]|jgi:4-oxalmesaconate hydratase
MIVDCHGHFTTTPAELQIFRDAQLAVLQDSRQAAPALRAISDDEIRAGVEPNQLRLMDERGEDLMLFSPKASAMEHHRADRPTAVAWARTSNDLVHRVVSLYPQRFAGVCQLPQTPDGSLEDSVAELRRCVEELGFVGCNLSPDPSGGHWTAPPLTDPHWFPLYEAMVELDVPAMIHVSSSCAPAVHALGAHYLNADTTVFMQLIEGDLFGTFPTLRFVIPHGGGAVPYHWGRFRGLADRLGRPPLNEHVMGNVFFDTAVYHQAGIDLLIRVIDVNNLLFASEMIGAVRGIDPETGHHWDDTLRYLNAAALPEPDREAIFLGNALRVYPRLAARS